MREIAASDINAAANRIEPFVPVTNLTRSHYLSELIQGNVFLKEEHRQITNSFKIRGASNTVLINDTIGTFVTASTGNHALAVCHILSKVGKRGIIFVTSTIPESKLEKLKKFPFIELKIVQGDPQLGELAARKFAIENNLKFISPYNDYQVIAGQGTCGLEIMQQQPEIDNIFVCVGGGGLISGISIGAKSIKPDVTIVGCLPKNGEVMLASIKAGKITDLEYKETLSDGSAGNLEPESVTFELCKNNVDMWISVEEAEIRKGIQLIATHEKQIIEGAAAVSVASFLRMKDQLIGKSVAIVLCGGSINTDIFAEIIAEN